jgi:hypothetical protein
LNHSLTSDQVRQEVLQHHTFLQGRHQRAGQRKGKIIERFSRHGLVLIRSIQEYFGISKAPSAVVFRNGKELKKTEGMDPQVMKEIMEMLQSTN